MSNRRNWLIGGGAAVLSTIIAAAGAVLLISPGQPANLLDKAGLAIKGSISERAFANINGVRQGMIIQSANTANPVLLFLHGGPGMPELFLNTTHPTGLEQHFTVVWWEQRGAGLSYNADIAPDTMNVPQLIADTVSVTHYLRKRFAKDKIYLFGHSWGSFLGIQAAAAAPELYHAYIGMGQVSFQLQSEIAAHRFMRDQYRARGDGAMVARLEAAPVNMTSGLSPAYLRLRDKAMHGLGVGTTRDMTSVISGVFVPVWLNRAYTVRDKINIWRGINFCRRTLWEDFIKTDLTAKIQKLDLPVYFFTGLYDYTANHQLSRQFFDRINAPVKGFYTFANSAHAPLFEEPERARTILMQDVLKRGVRLADNPPAR